MIVTARDSRDAQWRELTIQGDRIAAIRPVEGPGPIGPDDDWVAPAFWDIQINGRWGHSFSDPDLTVEQVAVWNLRLIPPASLVSDIAYFCFVGDRGVDDMGNFGAKRDSPRNSPLAPLCTKIHKLSRRSPLSPCPPRPVGH